MLKSKLVYKNYMLVLLTVIAAFNYLDRYVLSLVLEPIKQEFQLSDSELGFMTGMAFALFYAIAGVPLARWSDRGNRNVVITITTGLWSAMVVLCGLVGNYTQLLLVRVGVAVGEAGCLPPAQSLIADYFNRAERPRAMATYWLCFPISVIAGFLGGGWLAETVGWRMTFIIMGVPGILLAILVKLTLREPRLKQTAIIAVEHPSWSEVLTTLWQTLAFRHIALAFCVSYFFSLGVFTWMPTFFMRSHAMQPGELGTWMALLIGVGGLFGTYLGGVLTSRYAAGKEALQMRVVALAFILSASLGVMIYLPSNKYYALAFLAASVPLATLINGAIFSAIQSLVNDRMRSVAIALIFLFANLIGMGLGPLAVGVVSDLFVPLFGQDSLRYALVSFSPGLLWVAYHYWKAAATIEDDIRRVESESESIEKETATLEANTSTLNVDAYARSGDA